MKDKAQISFLDMDEFQKEVVDEMNELHYQMSSKGNKIKGESCKEFYLV